MKGLLILVLVFLGENISAQTCCTAGAPMSNVISVHDGNAKSLAVTLSYEYKSINLLIDNDRRLQNDPRSRSGNNVSLKVDYVINPRWSISANLPLVYQSRKTVSEEQTSLGIGDLNLLTQYKLYHNENIKLFLAGGLELPTGVTTHKGPSGIFLSPDMQSGSGSIDVVLGTTLFRENFIFPFLSTSLELLYRRNGKNSGFASTDNFPGRRFGFGDEWISTIGFHYQIIGARGFFTPDVQFKYRNSTANIEQQTSAPNSGGDWISLPLGFTYHPNETKSIRIYTEIPLYQNIEGLQITTDFTIGIQAKYLFNKKSDY